MNQDSGKRSGTSCFRFSGFIHVYPIYLASGFEDSLAVKYIIFIKSRREHYSGKGKLFYKDIGDYPRAPPRETLPLGLHIAFGLSVRSPILLCVRSKS